MSPRGRKIIRDIGEQPGRALLVLLAIALGAAALTVALGARSILLREIPASFDLAEPAAAVLWVKDVDEQLLTEVRRRPGVVEADARRLVRSRVEVAPGEWRSLLLFGVRDFGDLRVSKFRQLSGANPPPTGTVLAERSGLPVLNAQEGDNIRIRVPGGRAADLLISGIVHDPALAPGWQDNAAYVYVSRDTLANLGLGQQLDELRITVGGNRTDARRVAGDIASWLSATGREVIRAEIPARRHPHADHMTTMLLLLSVFSGLALLLSGALAASVTAALLAKQIRQIGVMKTIGARPGDIARIYFATILLLAIPAVILGLGLGVLGARAFSSFAAQQLNLDVASYAIEVPAFIAVICVSLLVPLLAAAIPILRAVRMPVQRALQDPGISVPKVRSSETTLLGRFSRPTALAIRNSFRRPARLWLTLLALSLGGAALMTAGNVYVSLIAAVDQSLERRGDDIDIRLLIPVDAEAISTEVRSLPGVERVEAWGGALVSLTAPDGLSSGRYGLLAPPPDTQLLNVPIVEGRWPHSEVSGEIVVNRNLQAIEPSLRLGAETELALRGRLVTARVVGVIEEVAEPSLYANRLTFAQLAGVENSTGVLRVATVPGRETALATEIEELVVEAGSMPALLFTRSALRQAMVDHFFILLALLGAAAIAAVIVGGLGLAASMSLNVLERTREIGVIRAIGARPADIRKLILTEGFAVASASVILAGLLSVPLSMAITYVVGKYGLHLTLPLVFSLTGVLIWVVLVALITVLACLGPARRAQRIPISKAIAYE